MEKGSPVTRGKVPHDIGCVIVFIVIALFLLLMACAVTYALNFRGG